MKKIAKLHKAASELHSAWAAKAFYPHRAKLHREAAPLHAEAAAYHLRWDQSGEDQ